MSDIVYRDWYRRKEIQRCYAELLNWNLDRMLCYSSPKANFDRGVNDQVVASRISADNDGNISI